MIYIIFLNQVILLNGFSLISHKKFSERFSLIPKTQILYKLDHLDKKEKIKFNYLLQGRKGIKGLLEKEGGILLKP